MKYVPRMEGDRLPYIIRMNTVKWEDQNEDGKIRSIFKIKTNRT
jgi:hypothetical protein